VNVSEPDATSNIGIITWGMSDKGAQLGAMNKIGDLIDKGWQIGSHTSVTDGKTIIHTVIMVRYPNAPA
jgi:hypothetical protein